MTPGICKQPREITSPATLGSTMKQITLIIVLLTNVYAFQQGFDPESYREKTVNAVRIETPLKIDGLLEEALYLGRCFSDFIQFEPVNGARATEKTDLWIGYDDDAIYVGARLWDSSPDSVVGRVGRRDAFLNADIFEIIIDSYHDKRTGFSFQINPAGSIRDEVYFNDTWTDDSWDGIWEGKTRVDDEGWTAEMRIPYSQLRFGEKDEHTWGFLPTRYIQRKGEWDYFVYHPLEESGAMSRTADLVGIKDISPPKRREILPYIAGSVSDLPSSAGNAFLQGADKHFGVGADIKMGIGANLTIDATINPDFGQVEADPSTINLSDHETYYDEKRPFFMEGRSIFNFGNSGPTNNMSVNFGEPRFFYSRRIGRPPQGWVNGVSGDSLESSTTTGILGAAKISGKIGAWSVGGITALTDKEVARYYDSGQISKEQIEPYTSYNLVRAIKEIDDGRYGIGFMGTYTERFMDGINVLGELDENHSSQDILSDNSQGLGLDGWAFLGEDRAWALGGWAGFSQVNGSKSRIESLQQNSSHYYQRPDVDHVEVDPNRESLVGHAGRLKLNKERGNVLFNAALGWISPGFETNDLGLTWGTDVINAHVSVGYRWLEASRFIRRSSASILYANNHDFSGLNTSDVLFGMGSIRFVNFWTMNINGGYSFENLSNTALRGGPRVIEEAAVFAGGNLNSDYRRDISWSGDIDWGAEADGSTQLSLGMDLNVKLGHRLNLSVGPNISRNIDETQYVAAIADANHTVMYGKRYVFAQLEQDIASAELRIDYPISPRFSLEGYFQPFIAVGRYSEFKEYKRPESNDFLIYGQEGSTIGPNNTFDPTGGTDEDAFTIGNRDFNYKALVGTLVLRWEFSPGSTMYLVWTQNGTNFDNPGDFKLSRDLSDLANAEVDNVFAIKLSYWLGQ